MAARSPATNAAIAACRRIFDLEHYLDVIDRKPGALRGSTPLVQWRAQGRSPDSYDRLWERLTELARQAVWNPGHAESASPRR